MKIYVVMEEDVRKGETLLLKGFRKEEKAIEFLNLSVDKVIKCNKNLSIFNISNKNKALYYDDEDSLYYYECAFFIREMELI